MNHLMTRCLQTGMLCAAMLISVTAAAQDAEQATERDAGNEGPVRLQSVFVGDKEQPAVSYFIPWEGVGAPDNLNWNVEERYDQALDLVDRRIMLRSINLYNDMNLEGEQ